MAKFDQSFLDDIRDRVPISSVVGSRVTWDRKKTNPRRADFWACCPIHGEKSPSFHCEDRKGRYHCFGCGASGDHFRFLMQVDGVTFPRAVEIVADMAGIRMPGKGEETEAEKAERARRKIERDMRQRELDARQEQHKAKRSMSAGLIWKQTEPLRGSLGEAYFEWRCPGLCPPPSETEVRFHPGLDIDPDKPTGDRWPAIIARVSDANGKGIAVWRIYIARDGRGKMPVKDGFSAKLGYGPAGGGAVRLGGMAETIGVCEGIETGRAVRELGTHFPVWPCLSTSGIIGLQIPAGVKKVVGFPDPDGTKIKTRRRQDGTSFIANPPGLSAMKAFKERNPGVEIVTADHAWQDDYLEILQKVRGVPIR